MRSIRQVLRITAYNYRGWLKNPRVITTFVLAFALCLLLSNKAVDFAMRQGTSMQIVEAFVWTFGDSGSILLASLLLVMLFADMPFLGAGMPYYLLRSNRVRWALGQGLYILSATLIYLVFILACTSIICMGNSFIGDQWSETAATLGYSAAGAEVALPATIKTMEMSTPYTCMAHVFLLMLGYTLVMMTLMLIVNLKKGQFWGIASVFIFSAFGFLLNPEFFGSVFHLSALTMYKANVAVGWISPLNHATYYMHNFGYDLLPRLWMTYVYFAALITAGFWVILRSIRRYNFNFAGTD